ncbi:hypothetical protein SETIT_1G048700v2 [Setaria italica]|uniref:Uncharacterized protein n=2 Tax=Setaria TaxID=4554 RepID=A0A368PHH0_SETIT|nr:hypothetical protein SETIT_1G048700v2 [Setaria italica]TKW37451.1 hypothetical protein SEVIR_1G048400v2 [Setaria viridis]
MKACFASWLVNRKESREKKKEQTGSGAGRKKTAQGQESLFARLIHAGQQTCRAKMPNNSEVRCKSGKNVGAFVTIAFECSSLVTMANS